MALRIKRLTTVGNASAAQTATAFSVINKDIDRSCDFKTINAGTGASISDDGAGNLTFGVGAAAGAGAGTFTANSTSTVTITNTNVTANSNIVITIKTPAGTVNASPLITTITPGTGFTVTNNSLNTSVYNYLIIG